METTTSFEDFQRLIVGEERAKDVDSGNMKLCFNSFIEKAQAKEKERMREEARKVVILGVLGNF